MRKRKLVPLLILLALFLIPALRALGEGPASERDEELALRYAPVFYFHPAELFRPQPVDMIVDQARLRQSRRLWFNVNVLLNVDVGDLLGLNSDESYFLDVWYGDEGGSAYTNASAHRAYYEKMLRPEASGLPITVYAHVVRDEALGHITIQYWALYYYNDWFNKHEGDWEMVAVILTTDEEPEWVVLSQHHGGTRRPWASAPVEDGTHPVVYVALGSHANYFAGPEVYPNGKDIGNARVEIMDRTGISGRVIPEVILIPGREELAAEVGTWQGAEWLPFRGHWGEMAVQSDFGGPLGPADKGEQWDAPYAWGMLQPLDTDHWYLNRLRVEIVGVEPGEAEVLLTDAAGSPLEAVEELGNLALMHADLPTGTAIVATISVPPGTRWDVVAAWPDRAAGEVTRLRFADVPFGSSGRALLTLGLGPTASLVLAEEGPPLDPAATETVEATWDAPDLIWIAGILPVQQVVVGLLVAVLAGVLPTFVYVGVLYWLDRFEKEPKRLLAAAFVWGAIPAVLMAVGVELFFRLPPDLIGPRALEAVRLGLVAPLLQEALKGIPVLFIARRYRREFDDALDGILYGAMVGFGFAMTGNLFSYIGSFLLWGFDGLSLAAFAESIVYAMNHAFYAAIFGAGLGWGRLAHKRWQRWVLPVGGFAAAAAAHALHGLLARVLLGLNIFTVLATGIGLILVGVAAGWSLARQRQCLREELRGTVPDALYRRMVEPRARARAEWQALRRSGIRGWRRTRRLHQVCAEFAFKQMQARLWPDEPEMAQEAQVLRRTIAALAGEG